MPILRIVYETSESYRLIPEPAPLNSPSGSSCVLSVMSEPQQEPSEASLTPEEANRIIHSHRKVRYGKLVFAWPSGCFILKAYVVQKLNCAGTACWPCRQRKVKCDNKHPCENCVKRDHANLCSYNPKHHTPDTASGPASGIKRAHSPESESSSRRVEDRWPRPAGKHLPFSYTK
jgi:hypothetical protein